MTTRPGPAPFDAAADGYDASFTDTAVGRVLRGTVWRHLEAAFEPGSRVLELGCGTGEDARWLARRGHRVLATDVSTAMLERARSKLAAAGLGDRVRLARLDLAAIAAEPTPEEAPFDAVLSDFGAVNCVADVEGLAAVLHRWLRPGGRAVLVVMGPFCLWEVGWHLLRLRPRTAFRRFRDGREAAVGAGRTVRVWYPGPGALARRLAPWFAARQVHAIGALVPPPDAAAVVRGRPRLLARLAALDERFSTRLAGIADHYLMVLDRVDDAG